jgi:predicted ATP-binding protein involved in virulence
MSANELLRLDHLALRNFRCFSECVIDFHPDLTVFVAENGQGKSAILDAISLAFGPFVDALTGDRQSRGIEPSDTRTAPGPNGEMKRHLPTEFVANGVVDGQDLEWMGSRRRDSQKATTPQAKETTTLANALRRRVEAASQSQGAEQPCLPLVAFYGTGRLKGKVEPSRRSYLPSNERLGGYADCFVSSQAENAGAWYESTWNRARDSRYSTDLADNLRLLGAVRQAVDEVIGPPTGWRNLDWDAEARSLMVENSSQGRLPLRALSDGVRGMLAVVADVARRCVTLNPQFLSDAARMTPGLLLIDEVDMHLHPRWQQVVVDLLREAFPLLQVILTTHSPHVLSTVSKESIRVVRLRDGIGLILTPTFQTRGVMSADVLATIMGVDPIPETPEARELSQYRELIEDGLAESDEALIKRLQLVAHFGEAHPVMLNCDQLIRFQSFKVKRNPPAES